MRIKVLYDTDTHEPGTIQVERTGAQEIFNDGDRHKAVFDVEGSSAVLSHANGGGEFLQEAFDHVRELPFIQATGEL